MTTLNQTRPGGPYGPNQTFRTLDGVGAIYWEDREGAVHVCEGADVHRGVRLLWTLCDRDVPANRAFTVPPGDGFVMSMCGECVERWRVATTVVVGDDGPKETN